ncbi:MAG: transposase [Lentisphaerae bacterium]|nr:transposase [Lentisphaerota bacterium]
MTGTKRRAFQAEMSLKYCRGIPRQTEEIFGWNRNSVELGLHEKRTGITCLGAHKAFCGNKRWEEKNPDVAAVLFELAESHAQQDPSFRTTLSFTRLTAAEALKQLRNRGFGEQTLPSPRTMADVLNRNGYRLRTVVKAKPQKKFRKQTPFSTILNKRTDNSLAEERLSE